MTVVECHSREARLTRRIPSLVSQFIRSAGKADLVIVGACGHAYVPLARVCAFVRRRPVIADAFVSILEVWEEEAASRPLPFLRWLRAAILDACAVRFADRILLDTDEHARHFTRRFRHAGEKVSWIPVGSPCQCRGDIEPPAVPFRVFFGGSFLPLHGVNTIVGAAELLRQQTDIEFHIVGDARTLGDLKPPSNMVLHGRLAFDAYAEALASSHIALGAFGSTPKAGRVVPCKVYDALATGVALITADSEVTRSMLTDRRHAYLVSPCRPRALADAICHLRSDAALRKRLALEGHRLFNEAFTPSRVASRLIEATAPFLRSDARLAQAS